MKIMPKEAANGTFKTFNPPPPPSFTEISIGRIFKNKLSKRLGVVVAQLVERSLLIPEVHSLNPDIGKNLY